MNSRKCLCKATQYIASRQFKEVAYAYMLAALMVFTGQVSRAEETAEAQTPLPNPLSLEQALALIDSSHPALSMAAAELSRSLASNELVRSDDDLDAYVLLVPQQVKPAGRAGNANDNHVRFIASKRIYDFGRTQALESSAQLNSEGQQFQLEYVTLLKHLEIRQYYFDALLADLRYAVDNEDVANLYVRYEDAQEHHELGQRSDTELLAAENAYRELANRRISSQIAQQATRRRLALALNRPNQLPDELQMPEIPQVNWDMPVLDAFYRSAEVTNPEIMALQKAVAAGRQKVLAERARSRPVLSAELGLGQYERDLSGRNDAQIGLVMKLPLYQGARTEASVASAVAEWDMLKAQLNEKKYLLLQQISDLIHRLEVLQIERQTAAQRIEYRDRTLEQRRALYELEMQTTIGDAMARLSEAQWLMTKVDFDIAMTWAKLEALRGRSLGSVREDEKQ